jgi:SAM-dependent methyltransferase
MEFNNIIQTTEAHYSKKFKEHGTDYKGVDWGSDDGQKIRFEQLLNFIDLSRKISITDYGCGYGALLEALNKRKFNGTYQGYDISTTMIQKARSLHVAERSNFLFTSDVAELKKADYTLVSGIFNVKLETPDDQWEPYIRQTLKEIADLSRHGFVFNILSSYTPMESREDDLYYADPLAIFDYCMKTFDGRVAIAHDYFLTDFTVFVRLDSWK